MIATPDAIKLNLCIISQTSQRISDVCDNQSEAQLRTRVETDNWSAVHILAHLRACADVWGKGINSMLAFDQPTLPYMSPST